MRARESSLIALAAVAGAIAGLVVVAMGSIVALMHWAFFGVAPGEHLSARPSVDPLYAVLVPCLGGLALGLVTAYIARWRGSEVDPVEANALHGGRMVIAVDQDGQYAGMVMVAEAHAAEVPATASLRDLLHHRDHVVLPQMTAQDAIAAFGKYEVEALAVVDSLEHRQVVGLLSEAHTLRRFSDASERQRRELLGEL